MARIRRAICCSRCVSTITNFAPDLFERSFELIHYLHDNDGNDEYNDDDDHDNN